MGSGLCNSGTRGRCLAKCLCIWSCRPGGRGYALQPPGCSARFSCARNRIFLLFPHRPAVICAGGGSCEGLRETRKPRNGECAAWSRQGGGAGPAALAGPCLHSQPEPADSRPPGAPLTVRSPRARSGGAAPPAVTAGVQSVTAREDIGPECVCAALHPRSRVSPVGAVTMGGSLGTVMTMSPECMHGRSCGLWGPLSLLSPQREPVFS